MGGRKSNIGRVLNVISSQSRDLKIGEPKPALVVFNLITSDKWPTLGHFRLKVFARADARAQSQPICRFFAVSPSSLSLRSSPKKFLLPFRLFFVVLSAVARWPHANSNRHAFHSNFHIPSRLLLFLFSVESLGGCYF